MRSLISVQMLNAERWEAVDQLDDQFIVETEEIAGRFGDFFTGLQTIDCINASLYAENNFIDSLGMPQSFLEFLLECHRRIAKHLLLVNRDDFTSGVYVQDQPFIADGSFFHPTTVPYFSYSFGNGKICHITFANDFKSRRSI